LPPRCVERRRTRNDRPYSGCRGSKTLISSTKDSSGSPEGIFLKAFEERLELRPAEPHYPVMDRRPGELALLEALIVQHQTAAIPKQHPGSGPGQALDSVAAFRTKHHDAPGMRIEPELVLDHRREPIMTAAEIDRLGRDDDPNGLAWNDHRTPRSAAAISAMRAAPATLPARRTPSRSAPSLRPASSAARWGPAEPPSVR
jgi:hypothetical protein